MKSIIILAVSLNLVSFIPVAAQSLVQRAEQIAPIKPNPYSSDPDARLAGAKLFRQNCSSCHGIDGKGNGRRGTPPLATSLVRKANPGALFWILENGSENHAMPSFDHLPVPERWQLITYLQSLH